MSFPPTKEMKEGIWENSRSSLHHSSV